MTETIQVMRNLTILTIRNPHYLKWFPQDDTLVTERLNPMEVSQTYDEERKDEDTSQQSLFPSNNDNTGMEEQQIQIEVIDSKQHKLPNMEEKNSF